MDKSIMELAKRVKKAVDGIKPFNAEKAVENAELKTQASNLLLLAIDKMETNLAQAPAEESPAKVELTDAERIELSYLKLKGFNFLVRNEMGSVLVYVNKPHRDKETNYYPFGKDRGGYNHWIETKTPISVEEQRRNRHVELGAYAFIRWADEPMPISDIIE